MIPETNLRPNFPTIRRLLRELWPVRVYVELGVGGGGMLAWMDRELRGIPDRRLIGVDIWSRTLGGDRAMAERVLRAHTHVWLRTQDSAMAASALDLPPVDLLLVDADHSVGAVLRDYEAWLPRMRPGGRMLFHDINRGLPFCEVHLAWAIIAPQHPGDTGEDRAGCGLGILTT